MHFDLRAFLDVGLVTVFRRAIRCVLLAGVCNTRLDCAGNVYHLFLCCPCNVCWFGPVAQGLVSHCYGRHAPPNLCFDGPILWRLDFLSSLWLGSSHHSPIVMMVSLCVLLANHRDVFDDAFWFLPQIFFFFFWAIFLNWIVENKKIQNFIL